jgi:hypothetical protein
MPLDYLGRFSCWVVMVRLVDVWSVMVWALVLALWVCFCWCVIVVSFFYRGIYPLFLVFNITIYSSSVYLTKNIELNPAVSLVVTL